MDGGLWFCVVSHVRRLPTGATATVHRLVLLSCHVYSSAAVAFERSVEPAATEGVVVLCFIYGILFRLFR